MKSPGKVLKGVPVRFPPGTPKRRTNLVMTPEALRLFAYRYYLLGFGDTGKGFHGESAPASNKTIQSILGIRFNRLYLTREGA